ncbi:MAG: purine-nucleoside phosphorylase [Bacteroidetes bacterium]|nr:purine-nucleoside phosphorylase [Bacteroidota bacterium]
MKEILESTEFLKGKGYLSPEIAIILGTGLGKLVNYIDVEIETSYEQIPHFPVSSVEFHSGKLLYGTLEGKKIIAMHGRFHYYEGYDFQQLTLPVRVMKLLGVKYLLVSNAGGAVNLNFKKGSLMLIDDHINLLPGNPLIGKNLDKFGPRYPDMSEPYSKFLNDKLVNIAARLNITLHKGVYVPMPGPMLETRAEYRYLRIIGADVVGMSTVPEAIVAKHMNLPCAAISVITDECDPDHLAPVQIKDILAVAARAEENLIRLIIGLVAEL